MARSCSTHPPSMASLRPEIPVAALDRAVARCLAKIPTIGGSRRAIRYGSSNGLPKGRRRPHLSETTHGRRRERLAWIAGTVSSAMSTVSLTVWRVREPEGEQAVRFSISTGQPPLDAESVFVSVSPDGRRLAFVAGSGLTNRLWTGRSTR